jgi:sodium/bile acid cotransporter 7
MLAKYWFLASIGVCFLTGYFASESLAPLRQMSGTRSVIVFVVMWLMGITLPASAIRRSLSRPLPVLLAITINLMVVPLISLPARWWLTESMFGGLFVASLVPCTLASASVWTRKAGGDDSISLMTTVVTNLACVVVLPIGISLVLASAVQIPVADQMSKLACIVVAPLVLAQTMRRLGAANWADCHKKSLSTFSQFGILAMVLFGAVASAGYKDSSAVSWTLLLAVVLTAAAIHVIALWLGVFAARQSGSDRAGQIAVGISGSQKTLMVGLQIAIDCGVSVVPMLVYHLCQLIIDTIIADRWKSS